MRALRLVATALVVVLAGCATPAEKADHALIRGRRDPGAEAAGVRVAGPGAAPAQPVAGKPVDGRWGAEPILVAQAEPAGRAGGAAASGPGRTEAAERRVSRDGVIVSVRGDTVYLDLGQADGAAVGQRLRVVRPGQPLVHPLTRETLGTVDDEVALLEVTSVSEKFSTARVVRLAEGATVEVKDRVVAAPAQAAQPSATPAVSGGGYSLEPGRTITSQELPYEIRDIAVADLDGDRRVEIVAISESRLVIYRWTGRALEVLFEEEEDSRRNYITADAADLDGDGKAELVVNDAFGTGVNASVLSLEGRHFTRIDLPRDRYFRIVGAEAGQPTLVGQRRGDGETPFVGDIHRYEWRGGKARQREAVWVPVRTSIFDIQLYRAAEGTVELAALTSSGTLRLFKGREEVWSSQQEFDGTKLRVTEKNPKPPQSTAGQQEMVTAIPGRIVPIPGARGRAGDPIPAFALRLNEKASIISPRFSFSRGSVIAVAVEGPVSRELWRTERLEGYVAAFRLADLGDVPAPGGVGGRVLVTALDLQRGLLKAARSTLVLQPLR